MVPTLLSRWATSIANAFVLEQHELIPSTPTDGSGWFTRATRAYWVRATLKHFRRVCICVRTLGDNAKLYGRELRIPASVLRVQLPNSTGHQPREGCAHWRLCNVHRDTELQTRDCTLNSYISGVYTMLWQQCYISLRELGLVVCRKYMIFWQKCYVPLHELGLFTCRQCTTFWQQCYILLPELALVTCRQYMMF